MSENAILAALRRMGYTNEEMTGHGFRSMASTLLHEQGCNHQVIERQLAHAERNAVSASYNFAEHLRERRKMTQEKENLEAALRESGGRMSGSSGAAANLGISGSTLESKIRSLKINTNRFKLPTPQ